ncbi:hypothetical protein WMF45_04155 [Sorangium sp. So ce448]|uniref:hypothetical protein n=1 Tax=Sorangium sp. So ce448 TaxID=3133314 RepID=UPI003F6163C4
MRTSADLRATALRLAAAQELHPENRSPFVLLEDACTAASEGWSERLERLRAQHAERKARMEQEGVRLPELPERPVIGGPLASFGAQLMQLLNARADWHEGLVVVLAPTRVERPDALCDALRVLLGASGLGAVRWILIDPEPAALEPVAGQLGEQAMRTVFLVDEAEAQRDLARMLDAAEAAPPDIVGPARVGAAWPRGVSPPLRPGHPPADPESIDALLREEGVSLPLAGSRGTELARLVLRAAQAMRRGQPVEAVQQQARARDLCVQADLAREATLMELVLGAYLVAAGDAGRAARIYVAARERAEQAGLPDLGAQAQFALGALHLRAREHAEAAVAYARGAALARESGSAILTIEALRLAGQAQLDVGNADAAAQSWAAAIEVADAAGAPEVKASSAAEVARALAALFRRRGLRDKAERLEERSRDME